MTNFAETRYWKDAEYLDRDLIPLEDGLNKLLLHMNKQIILYKRLFNLPFFEVDSYINFSIELILLPDNNKCTVAVIGPLVMGLPLAIQIAGCKFSYLDNVDIERKVIDLILILKD